MFKRNWLGPDFLGIACIFASAVFVLGVAFIHHFTNNNSIVVDKRRPMQYLTDETTHIVEKHTILSNAGNYQRWVDLESGQLKVPTYE